MKKTNHFSTFYSEDDDKAEVDFNKETMTFDSLLDNITFAETNLYEVSFFSGKMSDQKFKTL